MNTSSMLQQSAHRDVLELPIPDTESSKRGLLEELKSRGRAAVSGSAWPDAKLLYEKAIAITNALPEPDHAGAAILHSNLSLVLTKMRSFDAAQDHAKQATALDPTYVKGWWRLGQAQTGLKHYLNALQAMERALQLESNNKALKKECDKLRELAANSMDVDNEQEGEGPKTEPAPPRADLHKPTTTTTSTSSTSTKSTSPTSTATVTDDDHDEDDKGLFSKSEPVRGYKIVNGKKTSYFHNELSEEAKELIGDIAPKKLDTPAAAQPTTTNGNTSVWNQAGTWEERDVTKWATDTLQEQLLATTYTFPDSSPAPGALARITKSKVTGHASFATVRGKKRYIYEFRVEVEWAVDTTSNDADAAAKGNLVFPDMDGSCELGEGYDLGSYDVTAILDNSLRPVLDRFVKNSGLRDALHQTMDDWVRQFKDKY